MIFVLRGFLRLTAKLRVAELLTSVGIVCMFMCAMLLPASAKAPPHATTVVAVEALAAPEPGEVLAVIPAETEVELTGEAAPGYLSVYYDGRVVWVPAEFLTLGVRPGIDTAVAIRDTPLRDAPMPDAGELEIVPAGEAVILTGARVGDYEAGSFAGTGGWLERADLQR